MQQLKNLGVEFYSHLYSADIGYDKFLISGMFPRLADENIAMLSVDFSDQEISTALFSMGGGKPQVQMVYRLCSSKVIGATLKILFWSG